VLAGTDVDLGGASVPVGSFARIPHDAVPAIREAVRDPLLTVPQQAAPDVAGKDLRRAARAAGVRIAIVYGAGHMPAMRQGWTISSATPRAMPNG
jgi:hypothetical protein